MTSLLDEAKDASDGLSPENKPVNKQVDTPREIFEDINSWDSVAKLLKLVDDIDTHIITLTGKDGRKYWVHREKTDLE